MSSCVFKCSVYLFFYPRTTSPNIWSKSELTASNFQCGNEKTKTKSRITRTKQKNERSQVVWFFSQKIWLHTMLRCRMNIVHLTEISTDSSMPHFAVPSSHSQPFKHHKLSTMHHFWIQTESFVLNHIKYMYRNTIGLDYAPNMNYYHFDDSYIREFICKKYQIYAVHKLNKCEDRIRT